MPQPRRRLGPPQRPAGKVSGTPALLPLVSTVGTTGLTATSVTVVGSVNPQGLSGTWWFVYGTTPAYGSTTTPVALTANSIPQTVTVSLTGLSTGMQYWAAAVGQTAGGTVTSSPVTFTPAVPQTVTTATSPISPTATPAVAIPHFQFPFQFSTALGATVVEQDSMDDVQSCVLAIVECDIGACPELPTLGIPDPTFQQGVPSADEVTGAVQLWEPRATTTAVLSAMDNTLADWQVALTSQVPGTGQ